MMKALLRYNADASIFNHAGESAIYYAASYNHEKALQLLLRYHADINLQNNNGQSPLHCVARDGNAKAVSMLLKYGANSVLPNHIGNTALHEAAIHNHSKVIKCLLANNNDINLQNNNGKSPLHLAAQHGSDQAIALLLEHGANINLRDNSGRIPLHCAAESGQYYTLKLLIHYNASNINFKDQDDKTALHLAAGNGYFFIVKHLLNCAANASLQDNHGKTASCYAAESNSMGILNMLQKCERVIEGMKSKVNCNNNTDFDIIFTNNDLNELAKHATRLKCCYGNGEALGEYAPYIHKHINQGLHRYQILHQAIASMDSNLCSNTELYWWNAMDDNIKLEILGNLSNEELIKLCSCDPETINNLTGCISHTADQE
ncbi:ankyrin repeat family protein [Orientia chuto str. Dubai]|uniref:Ankyrin repeat family protein n=2 Tax=Candidatus Orientia mediorientalis TaxID=911112 RepID=A0A0F3MK34_9RICK|nr:ankyrin repeat family protein [Orientia chuto str. Dubai]